MTVQLLTEHILEFLSLKGSCTGSSEYSCQNATMLEISCHGSNVISRRQATSKEKVSYWREYWSSCLVTHYYLSICLCFSYLPLTQYKA